MNAQRVIFLTKGTISGYLSTLFSSRRMEHNLLRSRPVPSSETSPPRSVAERLNQRRSLSRLARLARSTRGRVGAALLALGGGAISHERADAATILQGEVVENVYGEQPQRVLALDHFDVAGYRITTGDGAADDTARWFAFELSDDVYDAGYAVEAYAEFVPNPPATVVAPDQIFGGIRTRYFMVLADLSEFTSVQYAIATTNGLDELGLNTALRNAKVYTGFGNMTGEPQSLEEGMEMTEYVMVGQYPENIDLEGAWVFAQLDQPPHTPEPPSVYLAAAGIAAGALASRRRAKHVLEPVA